jgi:N-acetyl-anhydromuramyl-L-alanine amidase AmpD
MTTVTAREPLRIVEKPMGPTVSRNRPSTATVDTIMIHFTSLVTSTPDKPFDIDRMIAAFTQYGVSAHYLVDRNGIVYHLVPEEKQAYHAGRGELPFGSDKRKNILNQTSIGIETFAVGSRKDMKMFMSEAKYDAFAARHPDMIGFTPAQYTALQKLIADIRTRHAAIKLDRYHIIGHEEYAPSRRSDPGELFDWTRIGLPRTRSGGK